MSEIPHQELSTASESSLMAVYIRAMESQRPDALIKDKKAVSLVAQMSDEWGFSTRLSRSWPTFDGCAPSRPRSGHRASTTSSTEKQQGEEAFICKQKGELHAVEIQFHYVSLRCLC